ncbi:MAG TPA: hypothetical protein VMJ73_02945 [Rhizomicrobium sp.]|nr:hypothetical protein [Rhizomicrobium sp.]
MHFWSEGLGDKELVMGLGRAKLERKGDVISLTGIVDSPAPWEYEVKIQYADWITILNTARSVEACDFIADHVALRQLAGMAWNIVRFIVLLAWYRFARRLGAGPVALVPADAVGGAGAKKP